MGENNYENENGFLKGFSATERGLVVMTDRRIADSKGNYKETTRDLIFLASEEEVRDGGRWGLNAEGRRKTPTMQAADQDRIGDLKWGSGLRWYYYLETPCAATSTWVGTIDDDGNSGLAGAIHSGIGVAPASF